MDVLGVLGAGGEIRTGITSMTSPVTVLQPSADTWRHGRDGSPRDVVLAANVVAAMGDFERAVNAAASAGIRVEPRFERERGRLPGPAERYVAKVEMYRKVNRTDAF